MTIKITYNPINFTNLSLKAQRTILILGFRDDSEVVQLPQ
jgi:hypothetical protein